MASADGTLAAASGGQPATGDADAAPADEPAPSDPLRTGVTGEMEDEGEGKGLRVLVVASKPPWLRIGGGNLTLHDLVGGLHQAGVKVRLLVADRGPTGGSPLVPTPWPGVEARRIGGLPRPWWASVHHLLLPPPLPLARFRHPALARALAAEIADFAPDVVHLEQLHVAWLGAVARRAGVPVVLRQQNVESALAAAWGAVRGGPTGWLLAREARRLGRAEAAACTAADCVLAISAPDAAALASLAPAARIAVLPAAFAPATPQPAAHLAGDPPVVALGSFDWGPTRDGVCWFLAEGWPLLRAALPGAVLHLAGPGSTLLGADGEGVVVHGVVPDVGALYDPRAVVVVPLRAGSGVRLRLLEAWAAGVPVVTTPVGGLGLVAADGDGAHLAETPAGLVDAIVAVAHDGELRQRLVAAGRRRLVAHAPALVAREAMGHYRWAMGARRNA